MHGSPTLAETRRGMRWARNKNDRRTTPYRTVNFSGAVQNRIGKNRIAIAAETSLSVKISTYRARIRKRCI